MFSGLGLPFSGFFDDVAGFTSCDGLLICSHSEELLCHGASTLESLHQLPVSYEATWLLPRPDSLWLVVPSLASLISLALALREPMLTSSFSFQQPNVALYAPLHEVPVLALGKLGSIDSVCEVFYTLILPRAG
jgi:hypothetical protein